MVLKSWLIWAGDIGAVNSRRVTTTGWLVALQPDTAALSHCARPRTHLWVPRKLLYGPGRGVRLHS
jgi:hypothetical protein